MRRSHLPLLLSVFALACGSGDDADAGNGGASGSGREELGPCGEFPWGADCWDECNGFSSPVCVDGRWDCPGDCVVGPCAEPAAPGDACANGIAIGCEADETTAAACPDVLCSTCDRFYGPMSFDAGRCACRCDGSAVVCERLAAGGR